MEENIDSSKESTSNDEEPLKKSSFIIDEKINKSKEMDNKNPEGGKLDPNKQISNEELSKQNDNEKEVNKTLNVSKIKPKKEIPIEKKPFIEFINVHLLPCLISEFKQRGFLVNEINLKNTSRPIAGDKCWVIYCEINDICNFWLSFEKEDITSLKSISLCKPNQKPSVIESFLIDEKRITLQLIISRILQRLNGQKLIGIN